MSAGPSMSMIENSVNAGSIGVGNYKGVMLCNRPFGGSTATNKQANAPQKVTFTTGVVPETIGVNVPIAAKEKLMKRPKKDSVLAKHKKWLIELQKKKDRLEEEYIEEMQRKEESQEKFQEHERQMRLASKQILRESKVTAAASKAADVDYKGGVAASDKQQPLAVSAPDALEGNGINNNFDNTTDSALSSAAQAKTYAGSSSSGGGAGTGTSVGAKPAWAMTEEAAEAQLDEMLEAEEEDLINFAKSLDFDKYIGDIEVQTMMERLRRRITELEREVADDDMREADAEARAALRSKLEQMGKLEAGLREDAGGEQSAESKALAEARALLQEEEEMQAVHSAKSTAALLQQAKEKIETVRQGVQPPAPRSSGGGSGSPVIKNEPLIVTHEPNEGARLGDKNDISNLPYMHRNPAV